MGFYLAIDLGTTGCRSILFDGQLKELGSAYEEYGLITPRSGWTEQDADNWWEMTKRTAKAAIDRSGVDSKAIDGISVSSQGITVVPVDKQLRPLCNAISWLDVRATEQAAQIHAQWGQSLYTLTGKHTDACYTLPKLLWLRQEQQSIWEKAWKFLMPMDYLIGKLTGNPVTDHSMASGTLLYDLHNSCWSEKVLKYYDIPEEKLPKILSSGEVAGRVLPQVAQLLGLREDCIVAVGAQDQKCAALGAGLDAHTMTISLGTAGAITKYWDTLHTESIRNVGWCGYTKPGVWVTEGVINTAGTCLRWVRDLLFPGESYDTINREGAKALEKGDSPMFYPYLNGPSSPSYYPDAQGCFYGISLATDRGDFAVAVMEGVAFQIRIMLEAMNAYGNVKKLVLFGGGAKSPLWCQIIADATGLEIWVPSTTEAAGAGAAILAAQAAGKTVKPLSCPASYLPVNQALYEEKYKKYRALEHKVWNQEAAQ